MLQVLSAQKLSGFHAKLEAYKSMLRHTYSADRYAIKSLDSTAFLAVFDHLSIRRSNKLGVCCLDSYAGRCTVYGVADTFSIEKYIRDKTISMINHDTIYETKINHSNTESFRIELKPMKTGNYTIRYDSLSYNNNYISNLSNLLSSDAHQAYQVVVPRDNEYGYFQYFYLRQYANEFCAECGSIYTYKSIVWNKTMLVDQINHSSLSESQKQSLNRRLFKHRKYNPSPRMLMHRDYCEIILIEDEFNGLYRRTYKITRAEPFRITLIREKQLVVYKSEVIF